MKARICVFTGTRADYGLLRPLMRVINQSEKCTLQIIASSMHTSRLHGLTYREIESDGFVIDKMVDNLLSADTPLAVSKSYGLACMSFAEALTDLLPDIVVILGDRFEALAAAVTASLHRIPIAHISGGEVTEGSVDDGFRHCITKLANLHFPSTELYGRRIHQLGESPKSIFTVGALSVDCIDELQLLSKSEFEQQTGFKFRERNILVTYHPTTAQPGADEGHFSELLLALTKEKNTGLLFTKPNADVGSSLISKMIDDFVECHGEVAQSYVSLGQLRYLSAIELFDIVLGNSSSGLTEAPILGTPTIDVGDRQKGRIMPKTVVHVEPDHLEICRAIEYVRSSEFIHCESGQMMHPYGTLGVAVRILDAICGSLPNIAPKVFFDF